MLNEALHMAKNQLPSVINLCNIYCSQTYLASTGNIETTILQLKKGLTGKLSDARDRVRKEKKLCILEPMVEKESHWIAKARKLCEKWETPGTRKHLQVLKKDGFVESKWKNVENICRNEKLLEINKVPVESYFKAYRDQLFPVSRPFTLISCG
jgi:hypothetical protein